MNFFLGSLLRVFFIALKVGVLLFIASFLSTKDSQILFFFIAIALETILNAVRDSGNKGQIILFGSYYLLLRLAIDRNVEETDPIDFVTEEIQVGDYLASGKRKEREKFELINNIFTLLEYIILWGILILICI